MNPDSPNVFHGGIRLGDAMHWIMLEIDERCETVKNDVTDISWTLVPSPFNVAMEDGSDLPDEVRGFLSSQSGCMILNAGGFVDVDWYSTPERLAEVWSHLRIETLGG